MSRRWLVILALTVASAAVVGANAGVGECDYVAIEAALADMVADLVRA